MSASILDPKGITAADVAVAPTLPDIMPPVKPRKGFSAICAGTQPLPLAGHWSR